MYVSHPKKPHFIISPICVKKIESKYVIFAWQISPCIFFLLDYAMALNNIKTLDGRSGLCVGLSLFSFLYFFWIQKPDFMVLLLSLEPVEDLLFQTAL